VARALAAEAAGVRAIYASPLRRARATAQPIAAALGLELRIEPAFAEFSLGEREGTLYFDLVREGYFKRIEADPDYAFAGGESPRGVVARMTRALARVADEHAGENVIVVSHGAALGLAIAELVKGDHRAWFDYHMHNCALTELVLRPAPRLVRFNECGHLGTGGLGREG
jgi:2,3-bisphosphoglycerate-dependent phosphoglycerate mutase